MTHNVESEAREKAVKALVAYLNNEPDETELSLEEVPACVGACDAAINAYLSSLLGDDVVGEVRATLSAITQWPWRVIKQGDDKTLTGYNWSIWDEEGNSFVLDMERKQQAPSRGWVTQRDTDFAFIAAAPQMISTLLSRDASHTARIAELEAEKERLDKLVYVPGLWRCAKCEFQLVQRNLYAQTGNVGPRDEPGDKCPNCNSPLWRVTERDDRHEMLKRAEALFEERKLLEAERDRLREALKDVDDLIGDFGIDIVGTGNYPPKKEEERVDKIVDAVLVRIEARRAALNTGGGE